MLVYQSKNLINGDSYHGQTISSLEKRKHEHISAAKNGCKNYFHRAIKKYKNKIC